MVSSTPRPHFTPGKDPVPILQEAGWAPGPIRTGRKSRPHRDSTKYFIIILIVSTNYIFVHLLDNSVLIVTDARYKHEERSSVSRPYTVRYAKIRTRLRVTSQARHTLRLHGARDVQYGNKFCVVL